MQPCHCGSGRSFEACCGPYIHGDVPAPSAEALMRSRYSAYLEHAIDYLGETLHPAHRGDWDRNATRRWAEQAEWLGLEIVSTEAGQPDDQEGRVEFIVRYIEEGREQRHHERSRFRREHGRWYYVDGTVPKPPTERHAEPKVGRNDPCPCGSGRKYKKCCGA
jgi:SEC-C motif-containing protein